jgi:hypothetical protein
MGAMKISKIRSTGLVVLLAVGLCLAACKPESEEPDCVPAEPAKVEKKAKVKKVRRVSTIDKKKADWCRACVMGPKGWASCQVAYGEPGEDREVVRARSREKACDDAGFEKGKCPDKAVLAIKCKGDQPKATSGDPARALQKAFFPTKKASGGGEEASAHGAGEGVPAKGAEESATEPPGAKASER